MPKVTIKLIFLGQLPYHIDTNKIINWKSDLFQIVAPIDSHPITENSDLPDWAFSDESIARQLPNDFDENVLIAVTKVPIEQNYFARRYIGNRVCLSYYEMAEILSSEDIPLENLILRVMYSLSFVYKRYGNRIPLMNENTNFTHDATRGCIFDMNGIKTDVIYSLNRPQLCPSCVETLTHNHIQTNLIDKVQKELKDIKKGLFYDITNFVKRHPIWSIIISSITAIILGIIGSLIASFIYESLKGK